MVPEGVDYKDVLNALKAIDLKDEVPDIGRRSGYVVKRTTTHRQVPIITQSQELPQSQKPLHYRNLTIPQPFHPRLDSNMHAVYSVGWLLMSEFHWITTTHHDLG